MLRRITCAFLLLVSASLPAVSQSKKPIAKTGLDRARSTAGSLSFPRPKGFQAVNLANADGKFLAQKRLKDTTFSIFVIDGDKADVEKIIKDELVPVMFRQTEKIEWRDFGFVNQARSSAFEVTKNMQQGFDKRNITTFSYRTIDVNGKRFSAGSVWRDKMTAAEAKEMFEETAGGTEGGACDEVVKLIMAITKEKPSEEFEPCRMEIIQSIESTN